MFRSQNYNLLVSNLLAMQWYLTKPQNNSIIMVLTCTDRWHSGRVTTSIVYIVFHKETLTNLHVPIIKYTTENLSSGKKLTSKYNGNSFSRVARVLSSRSDRILQAYKDIIINFKRNLESSLPL